MACSRWIFHAVLLSSLLSCSFADEPAPYELYRRAKQFEKKGELVQAYILYSEAAAADPTRKKYWLKAESLRTRAAMASNVMPSVEASPVPAPDSDGDADEDAGGPAPTAKELKEARDPQPPFELAGSGQKKTFDLRGSSRNLFEQVSHAYGLDVVFDGEYVDKPSIRFQLDDVDYREALHALMAATGTFIVPISGHLFMVVQDTPQKRVSIENTVSMEIPIPEAVSLQDAQELARSVQQLMELQRFYVNGANRTVYFRDKVSKAVPAVQVLEQLLFHRPQVSIEMEFMTVAKNSNLTFGIPLPNQTAVTFGQAATATLKSLPTLFSSAQTFFGVAVLSAQLLATMDHSESTTILRSEVHSVDGQPATFHVGDKYPIETAGFNFGVPAGTNTGFAPSFTFEDLGLVLKVTPKIHGTEEVTLEIDAEFKLLGGGSINGIPIISNKKFNSRVRLKFEEWAAVSGLMSTSQAKTISGVAGLIGIPIVGPLLSNNTRDDSKSDTLLLIKPRLLSLPPTEAVTRPIFVGPDTRPRTPL